MFRQFDPCPCRVPLDESEGVVKRHYTGIGARAPKIQVAFAAFGENYDGYTGTGCSADTALYFTGQDQFTMNGLYDFPFREYEPNQGRWISPDPAGLKAVNPMNPQTLNRYAYVGNMPLNNTDPLGLYCALHMGCALSGWLGGSLQLMQTFADAQMWGTWVYQSGYVGQMDGYRGDGSYASSTVFTGNGNWVVAYGNGDITGSMQAISGNPGLTEVGTPSGTLPYVPADHPDISRNPFHNMASAKVYGQYVSCGASALITHVKSFDDMYGAGVSGATLFLYGMGAAQPAVALSLQQLPST